MKRTLAVAAALTMTLLAAGCGSDDGDGRATDDAGTTPAAGTSEVENETYARGADVAEFCSVLAEINDSIDAAGSGGDAQWKRIVASFDALDETGVPDDFPEAAVTSLTHTELLVRQSDSVQDFYDALGSTPPDSSAVDSYVSSNCDR